MGSLATCSDVIRFWDTSGGGGGLELRKTTNVAATATNSCCWNHNGESPVELVVGMMVVAVLVAERSAFVFVVRHSRFPVFFWQHGPPLVGAHMRESQAASLVERTTPFVLLKLNLRKHLPFVDFVHPTDVSLGFTLCVEFNRSSRGDRWRQWLHHRAKAQRFHRPGGCSQRS